MEFYVFTCLRFKILIIKNDSLIDLLKFYLTTKEVVLFETTLDKMVTLTTLNNYLKVKINECISIAPYDTDNSQRS